MLEETAVLYLVKSTFDFSTKLLPLQASPVIPALGGQADHQVGVRDPTRHGETLSVNKLAGRGGVYL